MRKWRKKRFLAIGRFANVKLCPQRSEIAAALREGQWPIACDPSLPVHVEKCSGCAELVLIAEALRQDRAAAIDSARLASPGLLWWRAQLQRRHAAIETVVNPIVLAGQVSLGVTILSVLGLGFWQRSQLADWVAMEAIGIVPFTLLLLGLLVLGFFGRFALYLLCHRE